MENKKESAEEFMKKKFHNAEWWDDANYMDDPKKKLSPDCQKILEEQAKRLGIKLKSK